MSKKKQDYNGKYVPVEKIMEHFDLSEDQITDLSKEGLPRIDVSLSGSKIKRYRYCLEDVETWFLKRKCKVSRDAPKPPNGSEFRFYKSSRDLAREQREQEAKERARAEFESTAK